MEVDWSKLPTELLNLISQRIYDEVDLIRFRSVCSTWRSSSIPNHHQILPFEFPLLKLQVLTDPNDIDTINNTTSFWYLSKQNIFLIKPPQQEEQTLTLRPWLISTIQNTRGQTKYYPPLPRNWTFDCSFVLDYNKLHVLHLGSACYALDYDLTVNKQLCNGIGEYMYPKKVVAATCHGKRPFIVGALASPPYSVLLKFGDENWKVIPDMSANFGDIYLFKGRPYAVDKIGKTIMVGPDSSIQLMAEPLVDGGNMKFLVESEGDLLLADVYDCLWTDLYNPYHNDRVRIDLFKLDEKEKKWVKLTSLGDRVLFLGLGSFSASASASDLGVAKGNCVIFLGNIFQSIKSYQTYVLDLDQGRFSPLSDYPEYSILFRPPHMWMDARYQNLSANS